MPIIINKNGESSIVTSYSLTFKSLQYGDLLPKNTSLTLNELESNLAYLNDHVNYLTDSTESMEIRLNNVDINSLADRITAIENGTITTTTTTTASPIITFAKAAYGTEVDVVSSYLTLKRGNNQGLFNTNEGNTYSDTLGGGLKHLWASEPLNGDSLSNGSIPPPFTKNNIWSTFDTTSIDIDELDNFYQSSDSNTIWNTNESMVPWEIVHGSAPLNMLGKEMIMLDVDDRKFYKVKFTEWASGNQNPGGALAYTRQLFVSDPNTTTTTTEAPTTTTTTAAPTIGGWYLDGIQKSSTLLNGALYDESTSVYTLDGINDYAEIVNDGTITPTQITLEAWVNPKDLSGMPREILRLESGLPTYMLCFQPPSVSGSNQDVIAFGLKTTNGYFEFDIAIDPNDYLDKWTHLVATYESGSMKIYSNGILLGTSTSQTGDILFNSFNSLLIGSYVGSSEFFNYKIGRPSVYTTVLDATQVLNNYNTYKPLFDSNLVLSLDAGSDSSYPGTGTNWNDLSSNNNDGTLVNGVSFDSGSLVFDGVDDYINFPSTNLSNTGDITIDILLRLDGTQQSYADILDYSHSSNGLGGFVIQQNADSSSNSFYFAWWNGSGFDFCHFQLPLDNTYFNLVITKKVGLVTVYINGVSSFTGTGSSSLNSTGRVMRIGANAGGGRYIKGAIGSVKIYNASLTESEVLQNYNDGNTTTT